MASVDRPRLDLPANVTASERMAPLVIPPEPVDTAKLEPEPRCLDEPPPYAASRRVAPPAEQPAGNP